MKTILITGSGTGIGKDTAFELARRGHHIIATTETEEQAIVLKKEALSLKLSMDAYKLDVTDTQDREKVLVHDVIDVLINNAGVGESGSLSEIPLDRVRAVFETNVFGPLALTQLVLKKMMEKNSGTIIFISSTAGRIVVPFLGPYCMTKFSLSSGAEAMRKEIKHVRDNVHVCVVEPGAYHTGFNQRMLSAQFVSMNYSSYFYAIEDKIKNNLENFFRFIEVRSTNSIARKIIQAAESHKPRFRYSAP